MFLGRFRVGLVTRGIIKDSADVLEEFDDGRGWETSSLFREVAHKVFNHCENGLSK